MNPNNLLKPGERTDDLQRNGYQIIQSKGRFCFGMDAVLLSGFAKAKPTETVIDLGTGTGIIPILMEGKNKGKHSENSARGSVGENGIHTRRRKLCSKNSQHWLLRLRSVWVL